jgi:tetratricopeptide (TPR) repeat protein
MIDIDQYIRACRLFEDGRYDEAEKLFLYCFQQDPKSSDVLNALSCVCEVTGRLEQAVSYLQRAVDLNPENSVFHFNYANLLRRSGKREESEQEYLEAVGRDPTFAEAFHGLGSLYLEADRFESAGACLQRAISLKEVFAQALHDLGQLKLRQGLSEDAECLYRRSLQADSHFLPALNSLGMLLVRRNAINEASVCFSRALSYAPGYLQARCNQAVLNTWCGNLDSAINDLQYALSSAYYDGDIHYNLALALLAAGKFDVGWQEYEWRFRKANPVPIRHADIPRWAGESLVGRRILIHAEQGYGDTLQFVRYIPSLAQQGAMVFVEAQDYSIGTLLSSIPGVFRVISRDESIPDVEFQLPLMSLPLVLGPTSWPPPAPPYLYPSCNKQEYWKGQLASLPGMKVGLAWAGRPEHENDVNRSVPAVLLSPLAQPGISLVSLQFSDSQAVNMSCAMACFREEVHDFSDSAALVAGLDLVVTVDSAIAHLAGGLGVPVWLLLPWNPDWRWMHKRRDSVWYPSIRIYRQSTPGQWQDVITDVAHDLVMG